MRSFRIHVGAAAVAFALLDGFANELNRGAICGATPEEQSLHAAHHILVFDTDGDLFAVCSLFRAEGTAAELFEGVRNKDLAKCGNIIKGVSANLLDAKLHFNGVKVAAILECTCFNFPYGRRNIDIAKGNTAPERAARNDRYGTWNIDLTKRYAI